MSFASKLGLENTGMLLTLVFYTIIGIIFFALLPFAGFPPHIAIMGILSLVIVYGLFRRRSWAIYPIVMLFFMATAFSAFMIYYVFAQDMLILAGLIAYLILTWVATIYILMKRATLES